MLLTLWLTDIERRFIQAQLSKYALIPRQAIISGFSLGSLKQWGRVTKSGYGFTDVQFPIAFSAVFALTCSYLAGKDDAGDYRSCSTLTNTGARIGYSSGAQYLVLGK